uniref:Protein kinase domain-containing protein n=1 Tax=Setaria italica TaxID=4555 RepID=K3ZNC9_SETIT
YIDPVYIKSGRFTEKSDVYSFGVVLLELITRKKAKYGDNSLPLDFVKCCKEEGNGRKLYDRDILPDDDAHAHRHMECLDRIGALAVRCLKEDVDERPTMAEVLDALKQLIVS